MSSTDFYYSSRKISTVLSCWIPRIITKSLLWI